MGTRNIAAQVLVFFFLYCLILCSHVVSVVQPPFCTKLRPTGPNLSETKTNHRKILHFVLLKSTLNKTEIIMSYWLCRHANQTETSVVRENMSWHLGSRKAAWWETFFFFFGLALCQVSQKAAQLFEAFLVSWNCGSFAFQTLFY